MANPGLIKDNLLNPDAERKVMHNNVRQLRCTYLLVRFTWKSYVTRVEHIYFSRREAIGMANL